jgi:type IV secretion system protein VirB9
MSTRALLGIALMLITTVAVAQAPDPRLRELTYNSQTVVTVPVRRGVVTLLVLDADEAITEVGSGLGGDCSKPDAAWCIAAQPGGRHVFVKPKSAASAPNNLAVVTDRRTHSFRFMVLADGDPTPALFRLNVKAPPPRAVTVREEPLVLSMAPMPSAPSPKELLAERLQAKSQVLNSAYSIAEGKGSEGIAPTLVFDDGLFTYLKFPGNRELPAVFHVFGDGSESLVNARMEDGLLVVDRISRRLMLRAGAAVVGLWNEAFDIDGVPPAGATTVPGVQRVLKAQADPPPARVESKERGDE